MGVEPRADLPIYIAALSPGMLRLAGEIGDGVILWLCNPDYIREVVIPEVTKGRERAGKPLDGFDIVAAVPTAVTDDPDTAREQLRSDLVPYFHLPFYQAMIERSGFATDAGAPDEFLDVLAGIGDADTAAAAVERYREAGATSPCIGAVPKTDFDATLEALARWPAVAASARRQRLDPPLAALAHEHRRVLHRRLAAPRGCAPALARRSSSISIDRTRISGLRTSPAVSASSLRSRRLRRARARPR